MPRNGSGQDWNQGDQDHHYQYGQETYVPNYDQSAAEAHSIEEEGQEEPEYQNTAPVGYPEAPGIRDIL